MLMAMAAASRLFLVFMMSFPLSLLALRNPTQPASNRVSQGPDPLMYWSDYRANLTNQLLSI